MGPLEQVPAPHCATLPGPAALTRLLSLPSRSASLAAFGNFRNSSPGHGPSSREALPSCPFPHKGL